MDEFRKSLQERRESVLSGLRVKMSNLRTQNDVLKKIIEDNNLNHLIVDLHLDSENVIVDEVDNSSDLAEGETQPEVAESEIVRLRRELSDTQLDLQTANGDLLSLRDELDKTRTHCQTLKEVNRITKELVQIRDQEAVQLKAKLKEIETTMGEREMEIMSENLRVEYTRQIENIKKLRTLYEQRARSADLEIESLKRKLADRNKDIENEVLKTQEKQKQVDQCEEENKQLRSDLNTVTENLKDNKNEMDLIKNDLHTINILFTKILISRNGNDKIHDLERLKVILEENRDLLREVTKRSNTCSIISDSVLPKLLCDLIVEAFSSDQDQPDEVNEDEINNEEADLLSTDDILENLPKIWRILTELIIHQKKIDPIFIEENSKSEDCFNSVETPTGPQLVLSVSKTFIKLKDLILEKKSLQKDTKRLKVLNTHLVQTLHNQESRLGVVSLELTKTWHLVNRLKREHRQLHTHEQVLRYQLQQKRRMLSMLKEDLESCRHKWTRAREKNEDSEVQWKSLREEFSSRKEQSTSVESGYSDEQVTDEDGDVEDNVEDTSNTPKTPSNESLEQMFHRLSSIHTKSEIRAKSNQPKLNPIPNIVETIPISLISVTDESSSPIPENSHVESQENVQIILDSPPIINPEPILPINDPQQPGPSSTSNEPSDSSWGNSLTQTEEEYTARRTERIKRLEQQCQELFNKVTSNKKKGDELSQQLDTIHSTRSGERSASNPRDSPVGTGSEVTIQEESTVDRSMVQEPILGDTTLEGSNGDSCVEKPTSKDLSILGETPAEKSNPKIEKPGESASVKLPLQESISNPEDLSMEQACPGESTLEESASEELPLQESVPEVESPAEPSTTTDAQPPPKPPTLEDQNND